MLTKTAIRFSPRAPLTPAQRERASIYDLISDIERRRSTELIGLRKACLVVERRLDAEEDALKRAHTVDEREE